MGALEADVLAALWAADDGATPAEVLGSLDDQLAYTTVMTILTRLWRKGLVVREREGRAYRYRPSVSEAELTAQRMRAQLEQTTDRAAVLSRFVGTLSRKEERILRRIVEDLDA